MRGETKTANLFPCSRLPAGPGLQKLIGIYHQVQAGRVLQRVKIPGGRLTGDQWRALARIAERLTPGTPLHLTTRQDIEIHDLTPADVPAVQRDLDAAGLTCLGAAGDTYRNIVVCPCAGTADGTTELMPLAGRIEDELKALDGIYDLPRKFKISLSCDRDCGQPWIHDLGLVALGRNGAKGFRVTAAGSLGARPGTAFGLFDWLPAGDVLPLVVGTVRVFMAHGDRENRRKARLRHVRERMGDETFGDLLLAALEQAKRERAWPEVELADARTGLGAKATLTFANGDVTPAMADALAQIDEDDDFAVRIAPQHSIVVFGADDASLRAKLGEFETLSAAARPQATVVACPGKRWCERALAHTNELADRIRAELGGELPPGATVCISGCPNGCSHPAVADIGLVGGRSTREGEARDVFALLVGGGTGRNDRLAERLATKLSADEAVGAIREHLRRAAAGGGGDGSHEGAD